MDNLQQEKTIVERTMEVYKHNDLIQKARFTLSVQEQRAVLYAISKIKPDDTYLKEYEFDIKDFYRVIGWNKESYTEFKVMMLELRNKGWYITLPDETTETSIAWFAKVRPNKKSGKIKIKFDEDMMPFLIQLAQSNDFYTKYQLQYVLPMSRQYSPRLYEILKSYQYNNRHWFFDIDELKHLLDCKNYTNFNDFKRRVLEPAVIEINKFTDITITWEPVKKGRKVIRIIFYMINKKKKDLLATEKAIKENLDGTMDILALIEENRNSVKAKFFRENLKEEKN